MRRHVDKIEWVAIKDIKLLKNPKIHSEEQIVDMVKSIEKFGFADPCLIAKDNTLLGGYCRMEACKRLGMSEIRCTRVELLPEEFMAYILSEGRIAEKASWDYEELISWYTQAPLEAKEMLVGWTPEYLSDVARWQEDQKLTADIDQPTPAVTPVPDVPGKVEVTLTFPLRIWEASHDDITAAIQALCMTYENAKYSQPRIKKPKVDQ